MGHRRVGTRDHVSPGRRTSRRLSICLSRHQQQALRPLGEVFGDDVVAAAMIDRLVHHAEVISLRGDAYRRKDRTSAPSQRPPPTNHDNQTNWSRFDRRDLVSFQPTLTTGRGSP